MSQRTRAHTTGAAARPISRHAEPAPAAGANATPADDSATPRRGKPAAKATVPAAAATAAAATERGDSLPLSPDALARALRAVATELERDPALAQRVAQAISETPAPAAPSEQRRESSRGPAKRSQAHAEPAEEPAPPSIGRSFHPTIVTGVDDALGPGVPDPFALRARLGEAGLREALATLRLGSLRAIIRQHGLDAKGALSKVNDAEKLRAHILAKTRAAGA